MADFDRDSMMDMFTYEMSQLLEQLEQNIIQGESGFTLNEINEIFRIMHTIKGSAAMMMFDNISNVAHAIEDMFYYLRENNPTGLDYSALADTILEAMDFIKNEILKIEDGAQSDGNGKDIIDKIERFLAQIKGDVVPSKKSAEPAKEVSQESETSNIDSKSGSAKSQRYKAIISFEDGCEMENIRAYTLVHNLSDIIADVDHIPKDIMDEEAIEPIRRNGFVLNFSSSLPYGKLMDRLQQTVYLKAITLEMCATDGVDQAEKEETKTEAQKHINKFTALIRFEEQSEMENVRSYTIVHNLSGIASNITYFPIDIIDEASIDVIRKNGFRINFDTDMSYDEVNKLLSNTVFMKKLELEQLNSESPKEEVKEVVPINTETPEVMEEHKNDMSAANNTQAVKKTSIQHVISVNVSKLDLLLNLMGELVIAEAMVSQNPELEGLELENFHKETRQLRKIINDVQDTVMSMRMVPLSTTFFKMHRIVRDMCKQLNKDVTLEVLGEETEVDKNIIEHISDPLMHIIRNSVDHGIEVPKERVKKGKSEKGTVILEAKNSGGDVLIIIRDDGAGLDKDKIMNKAKNNGLLKKAENEYTDKEIYQFIFLPGFSTNEAVTNYSGRGVGMDVVVTNLEEVGGSVLVESAPEEGSVFTLKIPLTLAIIEGMTIKLGGAKYTIPIISIKQSFKPNKEHLFKDPSGNEMIQVRGEVYNVVRLYEFFAVESAITDPEEGIMIMLENGDQTVCLLADELIGEQQVVVKTIPKYIKKIRGISGCTLLGNGDISLIIDVAGFFDK